MAKLSDLSDAPLRDRPTLSDASQAFVDEIDNVLMECDWAATTLDEIRATVVQTNRVTEGQRRAVQNIVAANRRPRGGKEHGGWSRRYEGY